VTYLALDLVMLAGVAALAVVGARAAHRRGLPFAVPVAVTLGVLLTLTVVFDSLMIAADLFRYDATQLVGLRVWLTPVEDLAWPVAAALALPSVWVLLTPVRVRDEVDA